MFGINFQSFADIMQRGGWVMWPLLVLSVLGLTLSFERAWFWLRTNNAVAVDRVRRMGELLRAGDKMAAKLMAEKDRSVYGRIAHAILAGKTTEAAAVAAVDDQRPRMDRFMATLSTIITAAPMLGILGTVMGLIRAFDILSSKGVTDPRTVTPAIAEALITTAAGLVVAILVLFPYNAFRAQMDRTLSRIETLLASMGVEKEEKKV
ncbi:MAG: MotA/TolQ/ExbB proton channel family protein [Phycisphaeraceae bacterium]